MRYDLTLEPGRPAQRLPEPTETASALQDDTTHVPREPYFPDPADYRRPLTTGSTRSPIDTDDCGRSVARRFGALQARGGPKPRLSESQPARPARTWRSRVGTAANGFDEMLKRSISARERPYFLFAIRSDWARRKDQRRHIERCLYDLLGQHEHRPLVFCTPAEACALLGLESTLPRR